MSKAAKPVVPGAEAQKPAQTIYAKLLEVKQAVPYLKKDEKTYSYKYSSPEQVLGTINPLLNERGLFLQTEVLGASTERVSIKDKNGVHEETLFHLDVQYTWIDTETGEQVPVLWRTSGCNGEEKGYGSALTYGERYFLLKTFNIPTGEDDPDKFVREQASKKQAAAKTKPADRDTVLKSSIWQSLKVLEPNVTKETLHQVVQARTGLQLVEANYEEINMRLAALVEEQRAAA